jgi:hypothetical protein
MPTGSDIARQPGFWDKPQQEQITALSAVSPSLREASPEVQQVALQSLRKMTSGSNVGQPKQPPNSQRDSMNASIGPAPPPSIWQRMTAPFVGGMTGDVRAHDTAISKALGGAQEPPDVSKNRTRIIDPSNAYTDVGPGVARGSAEFVGDLTTPENILMLAGSGGLGALDGVLGKPLVSRLVSAGFSAKMLHDTVNQIPALRDSWKKGNWPQVREQLTKMAMGGGMAALAARHAVKGETPAPRPPEPAESASNHSTPPENPLKGPAMGPESPSTGSPASPPPEPTPESVGKALAPSVRKSTPGGAAPPETGIESEQLFQRYGEKEAEFSDPRGVYLSPANVESTYAGRGGKRSVYKRNPDAKILDLKGSEKVREEIMRTGDNASAGTLAFRQLVGPKAFDRVKAMDPEELRGYAEKLFPEVDWDKFQDKQEVVEVMGSQMAKTQGYDAIELKDLQHPERSEFVGLTEKSMTPRKDSPASPPPEPTVQRGTAGGAREPDVSGGRKFVKLDPKKMSPKDRDEYSKFWNMLKGEEGGNLGFDRTGQAVDAILMHSDWADRWDVHDPELIRLGNKFGGWEGLPPAATPQIPGPSALSEAQVQRESVNPDEIIPQTKATKGIGAPDTNTDLGQVVRSIFEQAEKSGLEGVKLIAKDANGKTLGGLEFDSTHPPADAAKFMARFKGAKSIEVEPIGASHGLKKWVKFLSGEPVPVGR